MIRLDPCSTITGFDFAPGAEWRQRQSPEVEPLVNKAILRTTRFIRLPLVRWIPLGWSDTGKLQSDHLRRLRSNALELLKPVDARPELVKRSDVLLMHLGDHEYTNRAIEDAQGYARLLVALMRTSGPA